MLALFLLFKIWYNDLNGYNNVPDRSVMKKILLVLSVLLLVGSICSCIKSTSTVDNTKENNQEETKITSNDVKSTKETVNKMSEREFGFNPNVKFVYTEDDDYMKAITDDMVLMSEDLFGDQDAVEIPTPRIVKIDDANKNDIKVYGDFWIYGYQMYGTIFNTKNGSSNPGCYHLKDEDGKITVISKEFAEDGSNNWTSLVEICGGDEELAKKVSNHPAAEEEEKLRLDYAMMYAKANNLKLSGIKDYGWPVILSSDISDAEFLYNFYSAYFYEIRQDDVLNDMVDRLENLKKKYMTSDLIKKMDEKTADIGADAIINAQDVTESMLDTLEAIDDGGKLTVKFDTGSDKPTEINIKLTKKNGKKVITEMNY